LTNKVGVPHWSYGELRTSAERFVLDHALDQEIPIPITEIVELDLKIEVIPTSGMRRQTGIDAATLSNFQQVLVDFDNYLADTHRYRFSLAHELGHIVLHHDLLPHAFSDYPTFESFMADLSEADTHWLDWHADCFAGVILMPTEHLNREFARAVEEAEHHGLSAKSRWDTVRSYVYSSLARKFNVSPQAMQTRAYYQKLDRLLHRL